MNRTTGVAIRKEGRLAVQVCCASSMPRDGSRHVYRDRRMRLVSNDITWQEYVYSVRSSRCALKSTAYHGRLALSQIWQRLDVAFNRIEPGRAPPYIRLAPVAPSCDLSAAASSKLSSSNLVFFYFPLRRSCPRRERKPVFNRASPPPAQRRRRHRPHRVRACGPDADFEEIERACRHPFKVGADIVHRNEGTPGGRALQYYNIS